MADVGHDLLMRSQQNNNDYDSRQTSVAAGGSFTFGTMSGSGYINASQDKMKSRFDSVAEQTGLYAGDGGFDITVGHHTQLDGAVIASTATPDKNSLDTGTLGFSDIHNEADFKTSHSGISLSGGGSFGDKFKGNLPGGMISAAGNKGHAEGTTQAAVAEGTLTLRDKVNQKQDVADLSRDTEHANDSISPIFDKEKEQNRLKAVGMISDIGSQVADIARTQGDLNGLKAAQKASGTTLPANATEKERQNYLAELRDTQAYKEVMVTYGTGSNMQRGIQAATAALQGLAGGNIGGALAGASAPELANIIGHHAGIDDNTAAKAIAHAILGGVTAALQGNSAAAGAVGAASGELVATAIARQLYPDTDPSKLTEDQKQTVSTLATVSAGMAGGIAGGNTAGAAAGASAGKNAVENNYLSADQTTSWLEKYKSASTDEERKKLVDVASKADAAQQQKALNTQISKDYLVKQQDDLIQLMQSPGCDADCKQLAQYSINQLSPVIDNYDEMQRSNNIPKAAIATISLSIPILGRAVAPAVADLIGSSTLATRGVSAATSGIANATSQAYNIHNDPSEVFSPNSLITAMITGAATTGMKYVGTTVVSTAGAGISSLIDGKSPTVPMIGAAGGATLGYLFGLGVQKVDNKVWNPWSNGFKDYQNSRMPSIIEPPKVNQLPVIAGGYLSERAGKAGEDYAKGKLK